MEKKKVLIIGAGMTGLALGSYLQNNGYDTEIFELHNLPGGLCTSWKRMGYTFEGCIHWLCGSSPKTDMYTLWKELADIQEKKIINHESFQHSDLGYGKSFSVYTDADKLRQEMLEIAPEDSALIEEFIKSIKGFDTATMPVLSEKVSMGLMDGISFLKNNWSFLKSYMKWKKVSIQDFQNKFKNNFFRENFASLFGMYGEMPLFALIYTLGLLNNKDAGYPIGGSLEFARSFEKKYLGLGGKIKYNSMVEKILVKDNKAYGVRLADECEILGDIVVSAADGHYTIYNMLEGKYLDDEIEGYYKNLKIFPAIIQVSLGIAREFKDVPDSIVYAIPLKNPIQVDPKNVINNLGLKIYNFDPTLAPEGKTSVTTMFEADYDYWTKLKKDNPESYKEEKDRIAQEVIAGMDAYLGDIKSKVEVYDVATPHTYVRYTNNWKGSFEGFIPTVDTFSKKLKRTLPGLDNFYMIGQWVQPGGGLPTSAMHGRYLAQEICKRDGIEFKGIG